MTKGRQGTGRRLRSDTIVDFFLLSPCPSDNCIFLESISPLFSGLWFQSLFFVRFRDSLRRCFASRGRSIVLYERNVVSSHAKQVHMHIQVKRNKWYEPKKKETKGQNPDVFRRVWKRKWRQAFSPSLLVPVWFCQLCFVSGRFCPFCPAPLTSSLSSLSKKAGNSNSPSKLSLLLFFLLTIWGR